MMKVMNHLTSTEQISKRESFERFQHGRYKERRSRNSKVLKDSEDALLPYLAYEYRNNNHGTTVSEFSFPV